MTLDIPLPHDAVLPICSHVDNMCSFLSLKPPLQNKTVSRKAV